MSKLDKKEAKKHWVEVALNAAPKCTLLVFRSEHWNGIFIFDFNELPPPIRTLPFKAHP